MYVFTQRLFHVPYEWGRLTAIVLVSAGLIAFGDLLLPTEGFVGFISRAAVIALYLPILWFVAMNRSERAQVAELAHPTVLRARLAELRARGEAAEKDRGPEDDFIRSENLDEDIRNF